MKKIILTLALGIICQSSFAQNIDNLFEKFSKECQAENISIPPFMMSLGKLFMSDEGLSIVKGIRSLRILDLEDCPTTVKERFAEQVNKLHLEGYEPMIQVNEDGEKVRIFALPYKDSIKELLLVCSGKDDCILMQMKGKIKKEDIAHLVNEQTSKKDGSE